MKTSYFIVPRAGYFGDNTTVLSSHRSEAAAVRKLRDMGAGWEIREGALRHGDDWTRGMIAHYPLVAVATGVRS